MGEQIGLEINKISVLAPYSEAIVGDDLTPGVQREEEAIRREDGSWLFDGMILADDLKDYLDVDELPDRDETNYETLSGLMMEK